MVKTLIFPINEHQLPIQQRNYEPPSISKISFSLSQTSLYSDCTNSNSNLSSVPSSSNSSYSVCVSPSASSSNMNNQPMLSLGPTSNGKLLAKTESKQIRARKYKTKSSNNLQNIEKHQSKLSSSLDTKPKEIELLKLPSDKNEKFLKIPSVELTKEISSNTLSLPPTVSPFHMSISAYNCSTPKVKPSSKNFKFTSPPNKIQITTPLGSNEIILIDENGQSFSPDLNSDDSMFFQSFSNKSICCLCYNQIPNTLLSRSMSSQITTNTSKTVSNLPNTFTMNASTQFLDKKNSLGSISSASNPILFKTKRSKSYSDQSDSMSTSQCLANSSNNVPQQNRLNISSFDVSSVSFQSLPNNDNNKLRLPNNTYSSQYSINSGPSDDTSHENLCKSCRVTNLSSSPINESKNLSGLCTNKLSSSHSMYNFDAASFPEFNYIKKHMLNKDVQLLSESSSLVEAFLKNFDSSLNRLDTSLNQMEKSKSLGIFDFDLIKKSQAVGDFPQKMSNLMIKNNLFSKSTTVAGSSKLSRSNMDLDLLKKCKKGQNNSNDSTKPDNNNKNNNNNQKDNLMSGLFFNDNSSNVNSSLSKSIGFLNIYKNSKQSHSTGELNAPGNTKLKSVAAFDAKFKEKLTKPIPLTKQRSAEKKEQKSHLFDFYSYYNNKYNQENQRKRSSRSASISTTGASTNHFKLKESKINEVTSPMTPENYFIGDSTQFNMKKFARSFAKDIKSKASNLLRRRHTDASLGEKSMLPSRDEYAKWQTSFEHLLRHKYGLALFRGFLKTEFSDENIEFWLECEDYKFINKELKREAKAKKIYSDFVAIGSPREVNLDIEIRAHTAEKILNPSHDTFDRAQKRILALMEKDSYPRFLESDLYKNFISSYSSDQSTNNITTRNSLTNGSFNDNLPGTSNKSLSYTNK